MLALLDDYLSTATTPEIKAIIVEANEVFDRLSYEGCDTRYDEIVMMADIMEMGEPVSQIMQYTKEQMEHLLKLHGIHLADDLDLPMMTKLMDGILDLIGYENVDELNATITVGDSPEETFAELLTLTTDLSVEEVLISVEEVNPFFISQLKETINQVAMESEAPNDFEYIERLTGYCTFRGQPALEILEYISQGLKFGYTFVTYANLIGRQLEEMPIDKAADELIVMALISSDGHHNPRAVISPNLENYIADPNKITKIDVLVSDLLLRFDA